MKGEKRTGMADLLRNDDNENAGESETLLAKAPAEVFPAVPADSMAARAQRVPLLQRLTDSRRAPFIRLILYYVMVSAVMAALVATVPAVRRAFVSPVMLPGLVEAEDMQTTVTGAAQGALDFSETLDRVVTTLLVIAGALALVVPVARVYMLTKRFRYDPALVRSVIILPIVVAGIALVVKNSLALAFSLAGIVAAVRFRNTLKDPRDAVYVFLVIGIGLSAGVQALDVAMVMSLAFNLVVLALWKYNVGSIYSGSYARTGILSVGDTALLVAQAPEQQRALRTRHLETEDDIRTDGILLVHSFQPDLARSTVQEALADMASDWRLVNVAGRGAGLSTLEYMVRLKEEATPPELVGALDERWSSQVAAAEYVPFRVRRKVTRKKKKKKPEPES